MPAFFCSKCLRAFRFVGSKCLRAALFFARLRSRGMISIRIGSHYNSCFLIADLLRGMFSCFLIKLRSLEAMFLTLRVSIFRIACSQPAAGTMPDCAAVRLSHDFERNLRSRDAPELFLSVLSAHHTPERKCALRS